MVLKIKSYVYIVVFLSTVVPPSSKVSLSVVSVTCSQPHSKIGEYCKRRYFESKRDQPHSHNFYYSMLALSYYIVINLLLCLIYTLYFNIYISLSHIYHSIYRKKQCIKVWYYLRFQEFTGGLGMYPPKIRENYSMQNRNTTIRNVKTANPSISEDTPLNSQVSSSIKNNQSFSPFLVHYSVSTFSASDWIPRFYFIFCVTFSTDIYHWLLLWRLNVLLGVHC